MRDEICEECQGCGYVEFIATGYFSESFGNYLPHWKAVECKVCGGTGFVEVEDDQD